MAIFEFEGIETRYFSGTVGASSRDEAEGFITNEAYDYATDRSDVEITYLCELEPDCS